MSSLTNTLQQIVVLAPPILLAVTVHEVAHGYVADRLGDPTARMAGRLTLNPLKHLDLVGTLVFFLTRMIGWAKPVPVNQFNLRNPRRDMIWVALAGPASNIGMAVICALAYRFLGGMRLESNISMMVAEALFLMVRAGVMVNVGLAVFNLIPIPPLDGSNILAGMLPPEQARTYLKIGRYGFIILVLLIVSGAVDRVVFPVIRTIISLLIA